MRLSGLQRDVLSLYRRCLRAVRQKPVVSGHQLGNGLRIQKVTMKRMPRRISGDMPGKEHSRSLYFNTNASNQE